MVIGWLGLGGLVFVVGFGFGFLSFGVGVFVIVGGLGLFWSCVWWGGLVVLWFLVLSGIGLFCDFGSVLWFLGWVLMGLFWWLGFGFGFWFGGFLVLGVW